MRLKYRITLEILYPWLILAMFTEIVYIGLNKPDSQHLVLFLDEILLLLYCCIDYAYLCLSKYRVKNSSFLMDVPALLSLYAAFRGLVAANDGLTIIPMVFLLITHSLYVLWNYSEKESMTLKFLNFTIVAAMTINCVYLSDIFLLSSLIFMCVGLLNVTMSKAKAQIIP